MMNAGTVPGRVFKGLGMRGIFLFPVPGILDSADEFGPYRVGCGTIEKTTTLSSALKGLYSIARYGVPGIRISPNTPPPPCGSEGSNLILYGCTRETQGTILRLE